MCNVKYDFKVLTLTRQQSHTDRGTTHLRLERSSLKKKNKTTTKSLWKDSDAIRCSLESAAKRVVLMNNMTDASSSKALCVHHI